MCVWLWACVRACAHMHLCVQAFTHAGYDQWLAGDKGAAKKKRDEFLCSLVSLWCGPLFTVSFSSELTTTLTLPLTCHWWSGWPSFCYSSAPIPLHCIWLECTWLCVHMFTGIKIAWLFILSPCVWPKGLHSFCKSLQDLFNRTFMRGNRKVYAIM